ncbi:hypothetical protein VIGAN_01242100 [Vigna angularis var. angularis]|uniref:Uncharacterized protein n=1 Tax=Vigna angularis var. angularis TaxID=157739 RepID=A0A0S3R246_PHAAN|nr:hypothetical protein VIGAN_01242100 [Vigna angularis var. angularis]
MENLALHDHDHDAGKSTFFSAYRSAFTTFSESNHHPLSPPIVSTRADSDPFLSPSQYFLNPNSPDASSYIETFGFSRSSATAHSIVLVVVFLNFLELEARIMYRVEFSSFSMRVNQCAERLDVI